MYSSERVTVTVFAYSVEQELCYPSPMLQYIDLTCSVNTFLTDEEAFVDSVDQDQTAQNVQSDL